MKKSWTSPEHVGKITISILNKLAAEFHKETSKADEDKDHDKILKLAGACGYQSQVYSGIQKIHDFAKRVEEIEKTLEKADPEMLAMGVSPVLIEENDQRERFALR